MTTPTSQKIKSLKSGWYVWFFPLIAILITAYLLFNFFNQQGGPHIRISFEEASSIQAGKTRVRFRGVTIGVVKDITISDDNREAIAHIVLQRDSEHFAVEGSKFWIVKPKVGFEGVSGLETLFAGTYIAVEPGKPDGDRKEDFKGQIGGESADSLEYTTVYFLESPSVESVGVGNSITFRGLEVGTITKITLSKNSQLVQIQINIQNRYVKLIRSNTVFWRKVGIQANLGLFNSQVKVNSLDSILHGGIQLSTPDNPGEMAKAMTKFPLSDAAPKDWEKWNPKLEL